MTVPYRYCRILTKYMENNRLYNFLEMNTVIYNFQFGFRQKYSTSHALIHLTAKIREQLDNLNFVCEIFVDLQEAFDTVDHDILIKELNHYGIRRVANNWFSSYLRDRCQTCNVGQSNFTLSVSYSTHLKCYTFNEPFRS